MAEFVDAPKDSDVIVQHVRECAAVSSTEAAFVCSLHKVGLLIRPGFVSVGDELLLVAYDVALPTHGDVPPSWHCISDLHRDLSLHQLRQSWERSEELQAQAWEEWEAHSFEPLV